MLQAEKEIKPTAVVVSRKDAMGRGGHLVKNTALPVPLYIYPISKYVAVHLMLLPYLSYTGTTLPRAVTFVNLPRAPGFLCHRWRWRLYYWRAAREPWRPRHTQQLPASKAACTVLTQHLWRTA